MLAGGQTGSEGGAAPADSLIEEGLANLRGFFMPALKKLLAQVHPNITAKDESLEYVESLILKLLAMLSSKPSPQTVQDVEERVLNTFPTPIDKWAIAEVKQALGKSRKKSDLILQEHKIHVTLSKEILQNKLDVALYIVAVLEYIAADIIKLTGSYIKQMRRIQISSEDVKVAICADKALMDMFYQEEVLYEERSHGLFRNRPAQTYDEVVRDLIMCEKSYLRDLNMITKVFRLQILKAEFAAPDEVDAIFSNITDIVELTITLISSLEDTLEMAEEGQVTAVGPCFEELAEAEEFDVYEKFAFEVLSTQSSQYLVNIISRPEVADKLHSSGHGFKEAVKFYLPKLILGPVSHCFHYFKYIDLLTKLTQNEEERDTLKQVTAMLSPLQNKLHTLCAQSTALGHIASGSMTKRKHSEVFHRYGPGRQSRQQSLGRLNQLQQSIVGWEGKDIVANSSEIVYEGKLKVGSDKKKMKDRYVILCDGLLIVCSQQTGGRRPSSSSASSSAAGELRYRDKYLIRLISIQDREDEENFRHTFEICQRDSQKVMFKCDTQEDKNDWMAALVMLNTKSMLERTLDVILNDEENRHPLRLPDQSHYRFAEEDSAENLLFEEREESSGVPIIKGATLIKLVERLTYHVYATPVFMKTFLTTYRSFCTPQELLNLLTDRFHIPDPPFPSDCEEQTDKSKKMRYAQDLKRFRKEYVRPVQFRVVNVLKHWVDQHFYDFSEDTELLHSLTSFLDEITGRHMRKWVEPIIRSVQRRLDNDERQKDIQYNFERSPPPIEIHIKNPNDDWPEILCYHPIEIARQLTLIEFNLYRSVKPSELVDLAWTREDKDKRSPNLLKMVRHTTNFTRYLEKMIVETDNIDERVSIMHRVLEILIVLQDYNNFNGVLAITSALNSSAVHRLVLTKEKLPTAVLKTLEDASSLVEDHNKLYLEKLRSINPPCVPFFGQYQTNILFLEEGNPDILHNSQLINFSKRRKVAEIISEIQQYQNQAYCLQEYPKLKYFLESLDPFPHLDDKEVTDYLWGKSIEIEPRSSDTIKRKTAERRWPGLSLKSPGVKPKNPPHPLPKISSSSHTSRQSKDESPLSSPNNWGGSTSVKQSPVSTPVTPSFGAHQSSPREESVCATATRDDPIKIPVILPAGPISTSTSMASSTSNVASLSSQQQQQQPLTAVGKPPPLPPKPRGSGPPLPPRESSSPPPVPPRLPPSRPPSFSGSISSSKPALESRHPCIEPVFPKRSVDNTTIMSASLPPIVPRSRNGEPSPRGFSGVGEGQTPPATTSPHPRGLVAPLPPPLMERSSGSAPGSASWENRRISGSSNGAGCGTPGSAAAPEMGSHFTFGHHLHHHNSANETSVPGGGGSTVSSPSFTSYPPPSSLHNIHPTLNMTTSIAGTASMTGHHHTSVGSQAASSTTVAAGPVLPPRPSSHKSSGLFHHHHQSSAGSPR